MTITGFHPITADWFAERFGGPTDPQRRGWPEIQAGRDTLIAAPTGSGKTLAAFLVCLDRLIAGGDSLRDELSVLYVSPLKALSNDIRRNLDEPLAALRARGAPPIRAAVRTGDTPQSERQAMLRRPPHVLVTTPESLYLLLTSEKSREMLRTVNTVIVDEIHALARDKRGTHLALSLARLDGLTPEPAQRIGLSATQRPIEGIACFLADDVRIVDGGHVRELDLGVVVPKEPLSAVCAHETWDEIYEELATLIEAHRSTLVFVNTRRLAERVTHRLSARLGEDRVASHHGSLSRETRLDAEARLKAGELKAIVATASLELGIDVGFIDLVCQIASPRSIATLLQRVGRSGHALGLVPKGRLLPLTRDDLLECLALVSAVRAGRLDTIEIPTGALDILAQQIVAEVAAEEQSEDALYARVCRAWPYRSLARESFDEVVAMLSDGIAGTRRRGAYLHRDAVHGRLRARRRARISALTSGGAIPETGDYRVVTEGDRTYVGSVNEDFAIESSGGDIFLLGNTSWRIRHVRMNEVVVVDAEGAPATIPFWFGEAPGRTFELSEELSRLRTKLADEDLDAAARWLVAECGASEHAAHQAAQYVHAEQIAIGVVPSLGHVVFERFFDESGGMQLVIHAPFGARINRAWGLALRKRFCRSFDFELQAAADENGVVLSLGPQHSFPVEQMFKMLNPRNAEDLLRQALLAAPMFGVRWRWNATRSLAILRQFGGKRNPPQLQRMQSEDLLASIFPDQTGCLENHHGDVEIPDHPLVNQTVHDCLHEGMDLTRWLAVLTSIEAGEIEMHARETREPSPFSHELLNASPYAFLDDAPLEERRARAVATRRTLDIESMRDLCALDPAAIDQVRLEAWPLVRDADELHDALLVMGALPAADGAAWIGWFEELIATDRATRLARLWVAAERLVLVRAAYPEATAEPALAPLVDDESWNASDAWVALVRGRLECVGPVTASKLAADLGLKVSAVEASLHALEGEGFAIRGAFTDREAGEWCDRRLLARIHRLTLDGLRKRIKPVEPLDFMRYLVQRHHLHPKTQLNGKAGLLTAVDELQGFDLAAGAWEADVLAARIRNFDSQWLDELMLLGELCWGRLAPPKRDADGPARSSGVTRVVPIALMKRDDLDWLLPPDRAAPDASMRGDAVRVYKILTTLGALFMSDLESAAGLLPSQLEAALSELVALGAVSADGFQSIRSLVAPERRWPGARRRSPQRRRVASYARGGRWSLFGGTDGDAPDDRLERWARQLLRRYGVVFRDLLARETVAPSWGELVPVYRRLEAQGRIRGGRFVSGVGGEQFAEPDAVDDLRRVRDEDRDGAWVILSAADPLNLAGIVTPGARVPAVATNLLALCDGEVQAWRQGGELHLGERAKDLPDVVRRALESGNRVLATAGRAPGSRRGGPSTGP